MGQEACNNSERGSWTWNQLKKKARSAQRLHIHMATVRDYSLKEIQDQHSAIAKSFNNWPKPLLPITGWNGKIKRKHVYRVVHVNSFSTVNLFQQLKAMVGQKEMENQTLIVIPGKGGGYYIVNSQESLKDGSLTGSNTCDPLLLIQPG